MMNVLHRLEKVTEAVAKQYPSHDFAIHIDRDEYGETRWKIMLDGVEVIRTDIGTQNYLDALEGVDPLDEMVAATIYEIKQELEH